jgi:hypothetical protein
MVDWYNIASWNKIILLANVYINIQTLEITRTHEYENIDCFRIALNLLLQLTIISSVEFENNSTKSDLKNEKPINK